MTLIPYSRKCQQYINSRTLQRKPTFELPNRFYDDKARREIKRILKDPLEFWTAMEEYLDIVEKKKINEAWKNKQKEYCIKYYEIVFLVFDINLFYDKKELVSRISEILKIDYIDACVIFKIWVDYELISLDREKTAQELIDYYEVSFLLSLGLYDIKNSISRENWLKKNNKKIIEKDQEISQ